MKKITIYRDDREQEPWDDILNATKEFVVETKRLDTGDYTIKGMENIVCIEKKSGWDEIMQNISNASGRERLIKELRRIQEYPIRILVIHGDFHKIGKYAFARHITPASVHFWLNTIMLEYGIHVMCIGHKSRSKHVLQDLFKKLYAFRREGRLFLTKEF